jgi:thiosulfate/3-mercaptopyruvate sulfurtransferase
MTGLGQPLKNIGETILKTLSSFCSAILLLSSTLANAEHLDPLIDGFKLADLSESGSVSVLEIRSSEKEYVKTHIPGSVHIPYGAFRGPKNNPGKLPELNKLATVLGSKGLNPENAVVIVHDGITTSDFGAAARVYWTLKSVGFKELAILNGGFRGYQKDGFEQASGYTNVVASNPQLTFNPQWYADTDLVVDQVSGSGKFRLLDARLDNFYAGQAWHNAAARPGILPGADQFSFEAFFDKDTPLLKHPEEITQIVNENGLNRKQTISYCNTGHWAATNWFVLNELAGVDDVKLYAASMVEWSAQDRPMENVPSAVEFTILKTKKWFNGLVN